MLWFKGFFLLLLVESALNQNLLAKYDSIFIRVGIHCYISLLNWITKSNWSPEFCTFYKFCFVELLFIVLIIFPFIFLFEHMQLIAASNELRLFLLYWNGVQKYIKLKCIIILGPNYFSLYPSSMMFYSDATLNYDK